MIDLYFWPTGNGKKIVILLDELGLPYTIKPINIGRGDQLTPEFLKISPNGRMPAIVDDEPMGGGEPLSIFESGAIMTYLAGQVEADAAAAQSVSKAPSDSLGSKTDAAAMSRYVRFMCRTAGLPKNAPT
jgi:glutathione S-transferase